MRAGESPAGAPPELVLGLGGAEAGLPSMDGPSGAWVVGLLDPDSRGTVRLTSSDPAVDPSLPASPPRSPAAA